MSTVKITAVTKKPKVSEKRRKKKKVPAADREKINGKTIAAIKKEVREGVKKAESIPELKRGDELIRLINANFDFKANSGQAIDFAISEDAFSLFVQCYVDRVTMLTPICVGDPQLTKSVTPSEIALFCWMALILHLRRVGQVTGDTISRIPSFAEELSIPVPLASFISYYGKYVLQDQNLSSSYKLPDGFMNANLSFAQLDPNLTYPFPVYDAGLVYDRLNHGGLNELVANRTWTPISVANWCGDRLFKVANHMKSLSIAMVPLSGIHKYAPGIEAYCCRGKDPYTGQPIVGRVFSLVAPVDWELAYLFSAGRERTILQTWRSGTVPFPSIDPNFGYGVLSPAHYLMAGVVFLLIHQLEFRHGRIKNVYKLGRAKIQTYAWSYKRVEGRLFRMILGNEYLQLQEQIPGFNDVSGPDAWRVMYTMHVLAALHLHHRCEFNSPISQLTMSILNSPSRSATAFYNQGIADAVSLPASIISFIESLGVVVSDGAMIFPFIKNAPTTPGTTWGNAAFAGNLIMMSWKGLNYASPDRDAYPFAWEGSTTLVPNVSTGFFKWDTTFNGNYVASTATFPFPIQHPSASVSDFADIWKAATGQQVYNNYALAMVFASHPAKIRFGKKYQMLSVASSAGNRRLNIYTNCKALEGSAAPSTIIPAPPLFVLAPVINYVGSSVVLDRAEMVQAMILPACLTTIDLNASTSTFICKMAATNSYLLLEEMTQRISQSGLNNSSMTLGIAPKTTQRLPNGEIVPVKLKETTNAPSAWDKTVQEVSSKLVPPAIGTAATVACDFIPFIGSFVSPLCGAGASALASMFLSRSTVHSQEDTTSTTLNGNDRLGYVKEGVAGLGKALKAAPEAIAGAQKIVHNVASAQVKGLDYRNPLMIKAASMFHN